LRHRWNKCLLKYLLVLCSYLKANIGVPMDSSSTPNTTTSQQVTVDVPEDRVAEFHAFFARFLAGGRGRGRRGHHRGAHRHHGRRCAERRAPAETAEGPAGITEV
jgi:hypothetical protein